MKKIFSFLILLGIILASNCSKIPENNDPVIGIWIDPFSVSNLETAKSMFREEWIFNDAFLGRYHKYQNKELILKTDFKWVKEEGVYHISYPGTDLLEQHVTLQDVEEETVLQDTSGNVVAVRE